MSKMSKNSAQTSAKHLSVEKLAYRAYSYVEWQRIHEAASDPRKTAGVVAYLNRLSECAFTDVPEIARFHKIAWNLVRRTEVVNHKN